MALFSFRQAELFFLGGAAAPPAPLGRSPVLSSSHIIVNNLRACINRRTVKPDILFQMLNRSISFMQDTKTFLKNWRDLGHDTCHKTRGYDAKKCHQDCQKQEQGTFAKKCREGGGFYKCCIR